MNTRILPCVVSQLLASLLIITIIIIVVIIKVIIIISINRGLAFRRLPALGLTLALELLGGLVIAQLHKVFYDAYADADDAFLLKVIPVYTLIVGCISLTFLQCAFSIVGSPGDPRVLYTLIVGCISLTFLQCVF